MLLLLLLTLQVQCGTIGQYAFPQYSLNGEYTSALMPDFTERRFKSINRPVFNGTVRRRDIVISIHQVKECDTRLQRRLDRRAVAGISCLKELVQRYGIKNKAIWNDLMKARKGNFAGIKINISGTNQAMLKMSDKGNNFLTFSTASWVNDFEEEEFATNHVYRQCNPIYEEDTGFVTSIYDDDGAAIQPGYRLTEIFSESCLVGDNGKVELPPLSNFESKDVGFSLFSFFNTQHIKAMLRYSDISILPDIITPTGLISKSKHIHRIKHCNDLRKSGDSEQLGAILSKCFIDYSYCPDTQLSFGLSKAFALIYKDKDEAECYLNDLLTLTRGAENSLFFLGRIHLYKGYLALLRERYDISLDELDKAVYFLHNFKAGETKAWLCYLKGVVYKIKAEKCQLSNTSFEEKCLEYFDLYLQHVKIEEPNGFFEHRGVNSVMLKMATVSLSMHQKLVQTKVKMAAEVLSDAKGRLQFIESSRMNAGGDKSGEFESLRADILLKERGLQDVLNASVSYFKTNPTSVSMAAMQLKTKIQSFNDS